MRDEKTYIRTFLGGKAWPLEPLPEDIQIEDIAHALSQQCRWTGHTREFFSVAQHCCLVSDSLPTRKLKLEGLLHDASEAYLSDISRPIKHSPGLGDFYLVVEGRLERVIAEKFGLDWPWSPEVKAADNTLLYTEGRDLLNWGMSSVSKEINGDRKYLPFVIEPWEPKRAEQEFLERFHLLTTPETFTTGEYAKSIGLSRGATLARLTKMEERGIVERVRVRQNQGGVVRPNVLGWRFLGGESGRRGSSSVKEQEIVSLSSVSSE